MATLTGRWDCNTFINFNHLLLPYPLSLLKQVVECVIQCGACRQFVLARSCIFITAPPCAEFSRVRISRGVMRIVRERPSLAEGDLPSAVSALFGWFHVRVLIRAVNVH